jgi:glutamate-1-semialdehyde 2,1-aminomutase
MATHVEATPDARAAYVTETSRLMHERAKQSLAGGVASVARVFPPGPWPYPIYVDRGDGSRIVDVDGNEYIDYNLAHGPLILGHRPPELTAAIVNILQERGSTFALSHNLEYEAAEKVVKHVPSIDLMRFTNSGTEAVLAVLRFARAFAGRTKIVRFEGHYHGWGDPIHWSHRPIPGASGLPHAPRAVPATNGIAESYGNELIIQPWNEPDILERTIRTRKHEIAAVITEPIMGTGGGILPADGYLKFLRDVTREHDVLLIFDEVVTGFRLGLAGAQGHFGVTPDLTTLAKAIAGGYPVGAVGGRRDIMQAVATHQVTHAGTYNGNLVQTGAVNSTLEQLARPGTYERLWAMGDRLRSGLLKAAADLGIPAVVTGLGPMLQIWFQERAPTNIREAIAGPSFALGRWELFRQGLQQRGVVVLQSQLSNWFVSTAHSELDIDETVARAGDAMEELRDRLG